MSRSLLPLPNHLFFKSRGKPTKQIPQNANNEQISAVVFSRSSRTLKTFGEKKKTTNKKPQPKQKPSH